MDGESKSKPYVPTNPFGVSQKYYERLQDMRLMDDDFMRAVLDENIEATQKILQIILKKDDLRVIRTKAQVDYKNLFGRSLRIDVDAVDNINSIFDIEIERVKRRATPKRLRFHSAVRDVHTLGEGEDFEKLPTSYIIFITEQDRWKQGLPLYHVRRRIDETDEDFGDQCFFIYVNGEYKGNDDIGKLMADFRERNPDKMHYQEIANRAKALKTTPEGVRTMCSAMEITFKEGIWEGYARSIHSLMQNQHITFEEAMDILGIPADERQDFTEYMEQRKEVA